jgi:GDP-L-fucose synthase
MYKQVIIVGSDGFLGRNLSRYFIERGIPCYGIGRDAGDLSLPDIADRAFANAPKADRIFHTVTRQRTGPSQYQLQGELMAINSLIHINILKAWATYQPAAKLLSMGSSCTYPESDLPLPESQFGAGGAHPSVYGYAQGKLTIATGSRAFGEQYNLKWLHCVLATMFGPCDHKAEDRSHFMGAMIDRAVREKVNKAASFSVWGNHDTVRELLFVDDQIDAIVAADGTFENRILNVGVNTEVTVRDAASAILDALKWQVPLTSPPGSFQGAGYKMLDSSEFLKATSWSQKISLREGTSRILSAEYCNQL